MKLQHDKFPQIVKIKYLASNMHYIIEMCEDCAGFWSALKSREAFS
jgi:hypothetical protein